VLCIGDSHTRGELGAPWVDRCCAFAAEAAGQRCTVEHITVKAINAGKNGEMACSIAARWVDMCTTLLKSLSRMHLRLAGARSNLLIAGHAQAAHPLTSASKCLSQLPGCRGAQAHRSQVLGT